MTYSLDQTETNKKSIGSVVTHSKMWLPMPAKVVYFRYKTTQRIYVSFSSIASAKNPIDD